MTAKSDKADAAAETLAADKAAAEPEPLKCGDVVTLKGGGPTMTVKAVEASGEVDCCWFHENHVFGGKFLPDMLSGGAAAGPKAHKS